MSNIAEGIGVISGTIIGVILIVAVKLISVAAIPLTFIFLILKLTSVISWGWFFVFIPLIIWGITMFIAFIVCIVAGIVDA